MDVDDIVGPEPPMKRVSFTSVNRPALNGSSIKNDKPRSFATASTQNQNRLSIDEDNRLAKLQALEMVSGNRTSSKQGGRRAKPTRGMVSMAEALDHDSSDGVEEVPAR